MNHQNPYIESIPVNLFNGIFNAEIKFNGGLNIISGENGTGKTQIIQLLKSSNSKKFNNDRQTERIVVFNPLRNAEKKTKELVAEKLRSQGLSKRKINEALNAFNIDDTVLPSPYPSFAELFVISYEDLINSKKLNKRAAVIKTRDEFNTILKRVFPNYEIKADWVYKDQSLILDLQKNNSVTIPIESLSRGENEVLSLLFNIYVTRDEQDIYLIDEPELHLNWDLERGLFRYLNWFCNEYKKQIIISTHSRVVFEGEFLEKTQFLLWKNAKIIVSSKPTEEIKIKIGGDALQLITAFDINKTVFYVEDEIHKIVIESLAKLLSKDILVSIAGNRDNVKNLCRYFTIEDVKNAYFLVDGDNEGISSEFGKNDQYIQLQKYSIENYFLNLDLLSKISKKSKDKIHKIILDAINSAPLDRNTKIYKKLAVEKRLTEEDLETYNAKKIIDKISEGLGFVNIKRFILRYLQVCNKESMIEKIFGEIVQKIKKSS